MSSDRPTYAIDFETYYSKTYSVKEMSPYQYVTHQEFDPYMVAIYSPDFSWVGRPEEFKEWPRLHGARVLVHNRAFDGLVFWQAQVRKLIPADVLPAEWVDTADMAAYLRIPRNLKGAAAVLLGKKLDKEIRGLMRGKSWASAVEAQLADRLKAYCLDDARTCYELWAAGYAHWPESERRLSQLNFDASCYGVFVDIEKAEYAYASLRLQFLEAERSLPWLSEGYKALSPKAIREQGRKDGIPVPASLAATSVDAAVWAELYGERFPWVKAVSNYRRLNTLCRKVRNIIDGRRPDGRFPYQSKYHGAAGTARFSGGSGEDAGGLVNMYNLPRSPLFGVELRPLFRARPGYKLIVEDYDQEEARILLWRVGDTKTLELLADGMDIYEAHARRTMGYTDARPLSVVDPKLRQYAKVRVLGLGYGCGAAKFQIVARNYGVQLTLPDAERNVKEFRENSPQIVQLWGNHQACLVWSANHNDQEHRIELASGRVLRYFFPRFVRSKTKNSSEIAAEIVRGDPRSTKRLYGGLLTENEIQATGRDVLRDAWLAADAAGIHPLWTTYDEIIAEVPAEQAEDKARELQHIMTHSTPWLGSCPLTASYKILDYYKKA